MNKNLLYKNSDLIFRLIQAASASVTNTYLTTAAQVDHIHGSVYTATTTGSYLQVTSASYGLSLGVPNWITTAGAASHTHSEYLTTAAQSVHTHDYQSTGAYLTTAMQSESSSVFVKTGFSTVTITGSQIKGTNNTDGLSLGVPAWITVGGTGGGGDWSTATKTGSDIQVSTGAATNTLYYGNFITTYGSVAHTHDYQSTGAYLTTAAQSGHTHSDLYQSTGAYLTTAQPIGNYLTTAMQSDAGSLFQSTGAYLTTAAQSGHTHSDLYQSTGAYLTTAMQSASSSVFAKTGFSSNSITGTDIKVTHNTDGLSMLVPAYITTAAGGGGPSIAASDTTFTSGTVMFSAQANVTLGTTVTNGIQYIRVSANISGDTAGDGVNIIAAGGSTANSTGTIVFSNSNGISFGLNGATITAQHNALTTAAISNHSHSLNEVTSVGTDVNIAFGGYGINFQFPNSVSTNATRGGAFEIDAQGAFEGDLVHIHQHVGNPAASIDMLHIEAANSAVTGLHLDMSVHTAQLPIFVHGGSQGISVSLESQGVPIKLNQSASNSVAWLNANYLQGKVSSEFQTTGNYLTTAAASNHTHSDLYQSTGNYLTTAMASNAGSNFLGLGTTTASTAGSDLVFTVTSAGLNLGIPKWLTTAAQSGHTHSDLYQSTGAYLTTAMQSASSSVFVKTGNTTGTTSGTDIKLTNNTNGISLAFPKAITTAMLSENTSLYAGLGTTIATTAGTDLKITLNTAGLNVSYPKAITTAAASDHTHGAGATASTAGSDLIITSASNSWQFGIPKWLTTAMQSASSSVFVKTGNTTGTTSGTDIKLTNNTDGISLAFPKAITTAMLSENTSLYAGLGTTIATTAGTDLKITLNTAGLNVSYPKAITTAAASDHTHGNISISATSNATETLMRFSSSSNGLTVVVPAYLTTAMASNAGSNYIPIGNSTASVGINTSSSSTSGVDLKMSFNSSGVTFSVPAWITTAAQSGHTHGAGSTASTAGSDLGFSTSSNGWTLGVPKWITTYSPGNGVSWELEGAQTAGTTGSLDNVLYLSGGNNVTLSGNSNTVIISAGAGGAGAAISASNSLWSNGTVVLLGSSNITVGTGAGSILLSVADAIPLGNSTAYQTGTLANTFMDKSYSSAFQTATLANTFMDKSYSSAFQTATLANTFMDKSYSSAFQTGTLSNTFAKTADIVNTSISNSFLRSWELEGAQTAGTTGSLQSSILYLSGGNMMTLSGNSNTIVFSVNTASLLGTAAAASFLYTSASSNASTNALHTSLSSNASTAAVHTSVSSKFMMSWELEGNNTAGTTGSSQGSILYLSGGNNVTLSGNSNTIIISAGAGGGGIAASIGGNSTSSGAGYSNITSGTMHIRGGNNITLSQDGASITISAATALGPASVYFSDNDKATWSSSTNGSSTTIMITSLGVAGGGVAMKGSGTYSQSSGTIEFANSNGITFGLSNNGTFTASYNSTQFAGTGTAATGAAITVNSGGVSVSVSAATGSIYFGDIAGYSWTSSTAASKTTFYLKTS